MTLISASVRGVLLENIVRKVGQPFDYRIIHFRIATKRKEQLAGCIRFIDDEMYRLIKYIL